MTMPFAPHGWRLAAEASALLFCAYTGYARVATLGEEAREPEKNTPRLAVGVTAGIALLLAGSRFRALGLWKTPFASVKRQAAETENEK